MPAWRMFTMQVKCLAVELLVLQVLIAWCGARTIDGGAFRVVYPGEEVQDTIEDFIHNGLYSHRHLDPAKTQVATPLKVTRDGALVSARVEHDHALGHARARRDVREHDLEHVVHYNLSVDGRELRLDLRPSVSFITPALVVERHSGAGRSRRAPPATATGCHYTGGVRGQPASRVALSACNGLAGMLRTEHGEYWIEPSNQIPTDDTEGRPHVIFKRDAISTHPQHRSKREISDTKSPYRGYENKEYSKPSKVRQNVTGSKRVVDQRRRQRLIARRRRIEALRRRSPEYRAQLAKLTAQNRQNTTLSQQTHRNRTLDTRRPIDLNRGNRKGKRGKNKGRRHRKNRLDRRKRNCATKQPKYQWRERNLHETQAEKLRANTKSHHRYPHHHQLSHRPDFAPRRPARSVSMPRHVEALVVADRTMTDFHEEGSLETYILTIMNMVSSLYMDPSIGNYIKVVVVKIILVEELESDPKLVVSKDADYTLNSFCKWQHQLNPEDDENPHHHDVAILVTRVDICSQNDAPCSTLGVAHVAGMCKPDRSCSINEDNGIMLAHTITHELGHNFGLYHDTEKIGCNPRDGATLHIMTPVFESDSVQVAWSKCSKRDVTNFLDTGSGECLGDAPSQQYYEYPEVPAGVAFDAATQCHLQFGAEAMACAEPAELCARLWCNVNNTCKTMLRPAAPGTTCGEDMWCQNLSCVARAPAPRPQHGGWGAWSGWSACSRSCGAGVSTQSRECNSPEPLNNGRYCIGQRSRDIFAETEGFIFAIMEEFVMTNNYRKYILKDGTVELAEKMYKICNTEACPINEKSFRDVQCSKYNNASADFVPYFDQDKPCDLLCILRDSNELEMRGGFVADGTPCRQTEEARDMCIAGVCHKVGCDWIVDSEKEVDNCGVCGGDGSDCKTVQGIYNKVTSKKSELSEVVVIPAGSRNVFIKEKVNPGNYITIASAKTKKLYVRGTKKKTLSEKFVAGSQVIYERDRDWEKVKIPGPIAEDLSVYQHIYRSKNRNPVVTYNYTVSRPASRHRYRLGAWRACSATCGGGYTRRDLECVDENDQLVERSHCYHIEPPHHGALMERCAHAPCGGGGGGGGSGVGGGGGGGGGERALTHWWVGSWRPCDQPCRRPGTHPTKSRNVYCVDKRTNTRIDDSACDQSVRPMSSIKCDVPPC